MTYATNKLPVYLRQYIAEQDYSAYTPIDHAAWRYIMRVSKVYFKDHAHPKYLDGLRETGVTTERIPRISEMDEKLQKIGWRAVTITGFIPPEPFMEFLALRILPIAADMRKIEHIEYTPAPDIVHEAAGHAPILADPAYSSYLKKFGEAARRVIFAKEDGDLYEAVLNLSETKEDPASTEREVMLAQRRLDETVANAKYYVSEAQQLTRLGWFSTEYGLIEKDGKYLIYGAGLLSSVGESYTCLNKNVKKVPLTIDCINASYDITKPQPQLFVTDDFANLEKVVDELASRMAFKVGGAKGLEVAKRGQTLTSAALDSGVHISGVLQDFRTNAQNEVVFLKYSGPSQLCYHEVELPGHGPDYHREGYSVPLGMIKGLATEPWNATEEMWAKIGCKTGHDVHLEFQSGITLKGHLVSSVVKNGHMILMSFSHCHIQWGEEILFRPEWGNFDLVFGCKIPSVYGGAADRESYIQKTKVAQFKPRVQKSNLTNENKELCELYGIVRKVREQVSDSTLPPSPLAYVKNQLDQKYPDEWLLRLELLELSKTDPAQTSMVKDLSSTLQSLRKKADRLEMLISRGLETYT